ncbi:MAG: CHRD domain-containing protein, partial [Thermoanaerobaculia bacterium]|nr:CHRD domain-containing protein [Thermoanaerobaculia bacterium]
EVIHDVGSPTGAHIHEGPHGTNGPVIFDLGDSTSPISVEGFSLSAPQIEVLYHGGLYVNIHSTAFPNGEIRDQLMAANLIFVDGFESGDLSYWQ